jgi:hypothetical protein
MRVQYADEAVVVNKPIPMKASNRLEDKIWVTHRLVDVAILSQKLMIGAKGGRNFKVCLKEFQSRVKVLKQG